MPANSKRGRKRKAPDVLFEEDSLVPKIIKVSSYDEIDQDEESSNSSSQENDTDFRNQDNETEKGTMTEEEYVTDLEKIIKSYNENYKDLELEEYKQMLQKFYTQNLRLATRCQKLKAAVEKSQTTTTRILREVSKQVNPHQLAFISAQLINNGKPPKKRVFSPQLKNIVVGLYQLSPVSYRYLSKILILPEEEEVRQWISQGVECDIMDVSAKKEERADSVMTIEAQAVLDEIAFENLMATLL